ncbi:MAG: hypothetical protein FD123_2845 [Bacteroidetes bacterium]|nr:MAG: hypothetical protein FD123_2845 [Bacteroidota bacterium]
MKTPSENLFRLVKSFDMNEKRYLTLFADQSGANKHYHELIRQLDRQDVFDERQLQEKLGISDSNYYKRLKHYAYETALRSLENYHANGSPETLILRKFMQAEILLKKKQYASLRRCIDQAYRLCLEHDKLVFLPVCLDWKLRTGLAEPRLKQTGNVSAGELDERLDHLNIWLQLRRINVLSWKLITRETPPSKTEETEVKKWIREAHRLVPEGRLDFTLMREYAQTMSTCYRLLNDWKSSLEYRVMLAEKIESEPKKIFLRSFEYLSTLNNVFIAYKNLGKKGLDKYVDKANRFYQRIPPRLLTARVSDAYINLVNNHIALLLGEKQIDSAYEKSRNLLQVAEKNAYRFSNSLVNILFTNMTQAALYKGEIREALRNHGKLESLYEHVHPEVMLLGLVIYYETGDLDLLHYRIRSLRNHLKKLPDEFAFIGIMATALSTYITQASTRAEKKAAFSKLREQIAAVPDRLKHISNFNGFDYLLWIDAHISQRSMREELEENRDRKRNF